MCLYSQQVTGFGEVPGHSDFRASTCDHHVLLTPCPAHLTVSSPEEERDEPCFIHLNFVTCLRYSFIPGIFLACVAHMICLQVRTLFISLIPPPPPSPWSTPTTTEATSRSTLMFLVDVVKGAAYKGWGSPVSMYRTP